jgi:flagellar secretion chaperone FliS
MNARSALGAYKATKNQSAIDDASPHQLIAILLEGALARVATAAGAMGRGEVALSGESIGKAIGIIDSLRVSLDPEQGGEIAGNLSALYDYMTRRLLEANATKDPDMLGEVAVLLKEIKAAWDQVPADLHHASA